MREGVAIIIKAMMILILSFVSIQCAYSAFTVLEGWRVTDSFSNSFCSGQWDIEIWSHIVQAAHKFTVQLTQFLNSELLVSLPFLRA